ncbi:FBD-associated F-box protein At4g10400-like [Camellia sinensis]|uniref:FBD-associated F-box protein At4g10400-like n=1 Tax=Camellia sinensis TaxID=4442 RepID=UPI0010355F88|nr:FBD-associated F-box protein At4g10400-like [Camellia sinensis]
MEFKIKKNVAEDIISNLPDCILHHILSFIPTKHVVTMSALSTKWRDISNLHLTHTTNLDFGEEFMKGQSQSEFTENLNKILALHVAKKIEKFHILFDPTDMFQLETKEWIQIATSRGVKELNLDFRRELSYNFDNKLHSPEKIVTLPNFLFDCKSLTHLSLSHCDLGLPEKFSGLRHLQTLCLRNIHILPSQLQNLLSQCQLLESLVLGECDHLYYIKILASCFRLKYLSLFNCLNANEIEISAPNIRRFLLCRTVMDIFTFNNICHLLEEFPVTFHNLLELQLVNRPGRYDIFSADIYLFFKHCSCPLLESLSIELPHPPPECVHHSRLESARPKVESVDCDFNHLKTIKISNFKGTDTEINLIIFFLEKAISLESLVVVGSQSYHSTDKENPMNKSLEDIRERLFQLPKASLNIQIVFCEYSEHDDISLTCLEKHDIANQTHQLPSYFEFD